MRILLRIVSLMIVAAATTSLAAAGEPPVTATHTRLTLASVPVIELAPLRSTRYQLSARFTRVEATKEPREGGGFVLTGRFAKGSVSCDASTIFSNGFETS